MGRKPGRGQPKEEWLEELSLRYKGQTGSHGRPGRSGQKGGRPPLRVTHTVTVGGRPVTDDEWFICAARGARPGGRGRRLAMFPPFRVLQV